MFSNKLILIAGALALTAPAFSQGIGPVYPPVEAGKFFLGAAVTTANTDWQRADCPSGATCNDVRVKETQLAVIGGYAFSDSWTGFAKVGVSDSKVDGAGFSFSSGPMIGLGVKGKVYSSGNFATGPALTYTWFGSQDKNLDGGLKVNLEGHSDTTFAWGFEGKWDKVAVYGGPQIYKTRANLRETGTFCSTNACDQDNIESSSNVGAYAGVAFAPNDKWRFGLELAHRAGLTASVGLTYAW
jgi:hypothetical protein